MPAAIAYDKLLSSTHFFTMITVELIPHALLSIGEYKS